MPPQYKTGFSRELRPKLCYFSMPESASLGLQVLYTDKEGMILCEVLCNSTNVNFRHAKTHNAMSADPERKLGAVWLHNLQYKSRAQKVWVEINQIRSYGRWKQTRSLCGLVNGLPEYRKSANNVLTAAQYGFSLLHRIYGESIFPLYITST